MNLVLIAIVAGSRVAIDSGRIGSVVDLVNVVPVPLAPSHVAGIGAVRSRVLTVIDAAAAVGLKAKTDSRRAIVLEIDGHQYALLVDAIIDVVLPLGPVMPFDPGFGLNWAESAFGTIDTPHGFALLVDPGRIVAGPLALAA